MNKKGYCKQNGIPTPNSPIEIETFSVWQDPIIEQKDKEIEKLKGALQTYEILSRSNIEEIERLKTREQECIDKYLSMNKYANEMESKYIIEKYIVDELEKWLEEDLKEQYRDCGHRNNIIREVYNKLKELKEESK